LIFLERFGLTIHLKSMEINRVYSINCNNITKNTHINIDRLWTYYIKKGFEDLALIYNINHPIQQKFVDIEQGIHPHIYYIQA